METPLLKWVHGLTDKEIEDMIHTGKTTKAFTGTPDLMKEVKLKFCPFCGKKLK